MADHLAHIFLRIGALVSRKTGARANFIEIIEHLVLLCLPVIFIHRLGVIEVNFTQPDDRERHVQHPCGLAGLLVAAVVQRNVLAHRESRGVLVARSVAVAAQPRVPEIDHAVAVGILIAVRLVFVGIGKALVGEMHRSVETRFAPDEHPECIGDRTVTGLG